MISYIKEFLAEDWEGFVEALNKSIESSNSLLNSINSYILQHGGKQLRPALSLLASKCCGNLNESSYYCAAVSEIIHTATLLHDDVADNGDTRRGVPTVRLQFSPAASVLTGDFWLSRGMHVLLNNCNVEILKLYTNALEGLAEGEIIQLEKAKEIDTTIEDYYKIIERKTASLFIAAVLGGATSVSGTEKEIESLKGYAYQLGIAFQIRDDIFDYSPKIDSGKQIGADIRERKITLPLLCAFKNAPEYEKLIREQIKKIDPLSLDDTTINSVIEGVSKFVVENKGIESAQEILTNHINLGIKALEGIKPSKAKDILIEIISYVGNRTN